MYLWHTTAVLMYTNLTKSPQHLSDLTDHRHTVSLCVHMKCECMYARVHRCELKHARARACVWRSGNNSVRSSSFSTWWETGSSVRSGICQAGYPGSFWGRSCPPPVTSKGALESHVCHFTRLWTGSGEPKRLSHWIPFPPPPLLIFPFSLPPSLLPLFLPLEPSYWTEPQPRL